MEFKRQWNFEGRSRRNDAWTYFSYKQIIFCNKEKWTIWCDYAIILTEIICEWTNLLLNLCFLLLINVNFNSKGKKSMPKGKTWLLIFSPGGKQTVQFFGIPVSTPAFSHFWAPLFPHFLIDSEWSKNSWWIGGCWVKALESFQPLGMSYGRWFT